MVAVSPDATFLTPGQFVRFDITIHGWDDLTAAFLSGIHEGFTDGSRKLMHGEWRLDLCGVCQGATGELHRPDEKGLLGLVRDGGLGYNVEAPSYISTLLVPFGKDGLRYGMSYWCGLR